MHRLGHDFPIFLLNVKGSLPPPPPSRCNLITARGNQVITARGNDVVINCTAELVNVVDFAGDQIVNSDLDNIVAEIS